MQKTLFSTIGHVQFIKGSNPVHLYQMLVFNKTPRPENLNLTNG